MTTSAVGEPRI